MGILIQKYLLSRQAFKLYILMEYTVLSVSAFDLTAIMQESIVSTLVSMAFY